MGGRDGALDASGAPSISSNNNSGGGGGGSGGVRGLEEVYSLTETGDPNPTGEFAFRSRSTQPPTYPIARGARDGAPSVAAAAEERMDGHLAAVRGVLSDALNSVKKEHDSATAQLRSDNRKLQHALAVARAREAELEGKLQTAQQLMSGLSQTWSKPR